MNLLHILLSLCIFTKEYRECRDNTDNTLVRFSTWLLSVTYNAVFTVYLHNTARSFCKVAKNYFILNTIQEGPGGWEDRIFHGLTNDYTPSQMWFNSMCENEQLFIFDTVQGSRPWRQCTGDNHIGCRL
jgi:hypothetical protein